jgi:hypothetical protein
MIDEDLLFDQDFGLHEPAVDELNLSMDFGFPWVLRFPPSLLGAAALSFKYRGACL